MIDLSILIPSRNEFFLPNTIQDILDHAESDFEIIAVLDGEWPDNPIPVDPRLTIIYVPVSIGQRAAVNMAAKIARGRYFAKVDAHCAFDQGFDVKLLADMQPDWTMIPTMKNLHAFNWICPDGHVRYQSAPGPCLWDDEGKRPKCGKPTTMQVVWYPKPSPNSTSFMFDRSLHFQYWGEYKKRQRGDLVETMSIQGSFFMVSREKYFELDLCDEKHGSWGQQGVEVACKTWLSGGRVICSKKTWYAHMFRTQPGFGFPYPNNNVDKAREYSRNLWLGDRWEKAIHPLSWLIDKFHPPEWDRSWGVLYYTDNRLDPEIMEKCQRQLLRCVGQHRIVSVSLQKINFGDNIALPLERGALTMFKQILAGLKSLDCDYVFFAEHDVLYNPTHFFFYPTDKNLFYYNTNVWKVRMNDGHGLYVNDCKQTSGLCADRKLLIEHYTKRVELVEANDYSNAMGFEPGTHGRPERVDDHGCEGWKSEFPNLDLRHDKNLTPSRWTKEEFRNQRFTEGWTEADNIPGWGHMRYWWKKM